MTAQAEEDLGVLALFEAGTVTVGTVCRPELCFCASDGEWVSWHPQQATFMPSKAVEGHTSPLQSPAW